LFAVLLNCPYPDPPVSFHSPPHPSGEGEGLLRGAFVAGRIQTITALNIGLRVRKFSFTLQLCTA